jgi:hypothetical protein
MIADYPRVHVIPDSFKDLTARRTHEVVNMAGKDRPNQASGGRADAEKGPTGAGAEAAEGIHDVGMDGDHRRSGLEHRTTGRSFREGAERSGSEPLRESTWVHESGYGGKNGKPRTSSDQRERGEQESSAAPLPESALPDKVP